MQARAKSQVPRVLTLALGGAAILALLVASVQANVKGDSTLLLFALLAPGAASRSLRTLLVVGVLLVGLATAMSVMDAVRNGPEVWKITLFSIELLLVATLSWWLIRMKKSGA
jgi:hypothetical protein